MGGKDAHLATHCHILMLRKLLIEACCGFYGDRVNEIALVLRIDGSVQSWHKSGVENLKFLRKNSYITADIYVPSAVWLSGSDADIVRFFASAIICSLRLIKNHVKVKNIDLKIDLLIHDVETKLKLLI